MSLLFNPYTVASMNIYLQKLKQILTIILFSLFVFSQNLSAQTVSKTDSANHEVTIYVIPSASPILWTNPSECYKSTLSCYFNAALKKNYYVIGHTIAKVNSPLLADTGYFAMSGLKQTEKVDIVLNKKVGFGALGSTIKGHFEPEESIKKGIDLYSKRGRIAFVKFLINEHSLKRILKFVDYFNTKNESGFAPCDLYNGALYPAYENEGSACSAFGMSLLDVANILPEESKDWQVDVNIPIELVGGEFNNNKKVKISEIMKVDSWYEGDGVEDVDYVKYNVYVPDYILDWVKNKRSSNDPKYKAVEENGIPGVLVDMRDAVSYEGEPIFKIRNKSNLFAKIYKEKYFKPEYLFVQ